MIVFERFIVKRREGDGRRLHKGYLRVHLAHICQSESSTLVTFIAAGRFILLASLW